MFATSYLLANVERFYALPYECLKISPCHDTQKTALKCV